MGLQKIEINHYRTGFCILIGNQTNVLKSKITTIWFIFSKNANNDESKVKKHNLKMVKNKFSLFISFKGKNNKFTG